MITVTFTNEQHELFQQLWNAERASRESINDSFGEIWSEAELDEFFQLPADELLEDMADHFAAINSGVPMF